MKNILKTSLFNIRSFFYPPFCFDCGGKVEKHREFCSLCTDLISQETVPDARIVENRSITKIFSCYNFDVKIVHKAVHALKYQSIPSPSYELLTNRLGLLSLEQYDFIVPIPLHWRRKNSRGYNQAKLLAVVVSKSKGIPILEPLKRIRYTNTQTKRNRWQRKVAMKQVFAIRKKYSDLTNKKILIVDDVCTTGATAYSCGELLRQAGACEVDLLTLAQA